MSALRRNCDIGQAENIPKGKVTGSSPVQRLLSKGGAVNVASIPTLFVGVCSPRVRLIEITFALLEELLKLDGSKRIVFEGMPADGRIVGVLANANGIAVLKVTSETFSEVPDGQLIPTITMSATLVPSAPRGREFL